MSAAKTITKETININRCHPGMVLATDVHNPSGQKIVPEGKELSEKLIRRLTAAGVRQVAVFVEKTEEELAEEEAAVEEEDETVSVDQIKETADGILVEGNLASKYEGEKNVVVDGDVVDGAIIETTGDVEIKGKVRSGTIHASGGSIDIKGELTGKNIKLVADKLIRTPSVDEAEVSIEGNVLVQGPVNNSEIDCRGNLVVHHDESMGSIVNTQLRVEGKLLADELDSSTGDGNNLIFRDPQKASLRREKEKLLDYIEECEQEYSKLEKVVKTIQQLGDKVKDLSPEKKKKLKNHAARFQKIQNELARAKRKIEECENEIEEISQTRRYFMRVLNDLKENTTITMDDTMINLNSPENDVQLYKTSMIVIQSLQHVPGDEVLSQLQLLKE